MNKVSVEALPNSKGYIPIGIGKLTHSIKGFHLTVDDQTYPIDLIKEPLSMYGCHIEYDYMGKGDCIDLSTMHDTYFIYPLNKKNVVTKISLATEEIYKIEKEKFNHANKM